MHPAPSIIVFTTLTGLGYGLTVMLGIGVVDATALEGRVGYGFAVILIGAGLISSTLHLGHPERAWRALSQWRSSWLSREGVLAILTFVPLLIAALGSIVFGAAWHLAGIAAAVLSLMTVYSTSMIYASLKTVHQWHSVLTSVVFVLFALAGGLLIAVLLRAVSGTVPPGLVLAALIGLGLAWLTKIVWWRRADTERGPSNIGSATRLADFGSVRRLEQPHTESNYLTQEMGFRVARKHAATLRRGAVLFGLFVPAALLLLVLLMPPGALAPWLLAIAVVCHLAGVLIERWLFFAEARHTVMLYYGEQTA